MLTTTGLAVILTVAGVIAMVAAVITAGTLVQARRDLGYVLDEGFGNGRLAAARGEVLLSWLRLAQAVAGATVTAVLVWIAVQVVSPGQTVRGVWQVVVALVAGWNGLVLIQALAANRIRGSVLRLGIVNSERLPDGRGRG